MKKIIPLLLLIFITNMLNAQLDLKYQVPGEKIMELADVDLAPSMRIDDKGEYMVLL